jgi:hypothetical protein
MSDSDLQTLFDDLKSFDISANPDELGAVTGKNHLFANRKFADRFDVASANERSYRPVNRIITE